MRKAAATVLADLDVTIRFELCCASRAKITLGINLFALGTAGGIETVLGNPLHHNLGHEAAHSIILERNLIGPQLVEM